jgi:4-hydroxy-tetrahydrodipicolinate reductase
VIKVCLSGLGKTGKEIAKALLEQKDIQLVAAICSPNSEKKGRELGEILGCRDTGIHIDSSDCLEQVIFQKKPDVVIDFSNASAALKNAKVFAKMKVNMVIGTTGFSSMDLKRLYILTRKYHSGIVYAPNITLGVNVLMLLTNLASGILNNYDFQITEVHHKHKKDAPSGTAKKIAAEIEKGVAAAGMDSGAVHVPIHAVRAGGVVGKHEVLIVGEEDEIKISHESFSRKAFAQGAIRTVKFICGKSGYFEMSDVLNLQKILKNLVEKDNRRKDVLLKQTGEENKRASGVWAL